MRKLDEDFNFTLVVRRDEVRFKLKSNLEFINKFLKILGKSTKFSELDPKIKIRMERKWKNGMA